MVQWWDSPLLTSSYGYTTLGLSPCLHGESKMGPKNPLGVPPLDSPTLRAGSVLVSLDFAVTRPRLQGPLRHDKTGIRRRPRVKPNSVIWLLFRTCHVGDLEMSAAVETVPAASTRLQEPAAPEPTRPTFPAQSAGKHIVHWFRKGLRLHDNPSLREGLTDAVTFRCVFIIDPWFASSSNVGINKWRYAS